MGISYAFIKKHNCLIHLLQISHNLQSNPFYGIFRMLNWPNRLSQSSSIFLVSVYVLCIPMYMLCLSTSLVKKYAHRGNTFSWNSEQFCPVIDLFAVLLSFTLLHSHFKVHTFFEGIEYCYLPKALVKWFGFFKNFSRKKLFFPKLIHRICTSNHFSALLKNSLRTGVC